MGEIELEIVLSEDARKLAHYIAQLVKEQIMASLADDVSALQAAVTTALADLATGNPQQAADLAAAQAQVADLNNQITAAQATIESLTSQLTAATTPAAPADPAPADPNAPAPVDQGTLG